jgi:hypothetical protein
MRKIINTNLTWELMKGTPAETGYKKLGPTPDGFPDFFNHIKALALRPYGCGADKLKATKAPMFSSTAMLTVYGSITSRKCTASRAGSYTAICGRARNRDWLFCQTQHTLR